ncbi:T6SS phospholipase effector Tle1-like catalytic domain-containing protein [Kaarinaea lacus]
MTVTATQVGIFFDGTGNNRDNDIPKGCESNIAKLYSLYSTEPYAYKNNIKIEHIRKKYLRGVGSTLGPRLIGGITGNGARRRLTDAYEFVKRHFDDPNNVDCQHKYVDVFGFSRGASLARHFVNMLMNLGVPIGNTDQKHKGIEVRFLGIFDSVASFGIPGNAIDLDFDFSVNPQFVKRCVHFVAEHERRTLFDLQSIKTGPDAALPENFTEVSYPGAHSDIGGGYEYTPYRAAGWYKERIVNGEIVHIPEDNTDYDDEQYWTDDVAYAYEQNEDETYYLPEQAEKSNELSRIPLLDMYKDMKAAGINLVEITRHPRYNSCIRVSDELREFYEHNKNRMSFRDAIKSKYIHDSRYATDKIKERLGSNKKREVYYAQAQPKVWQHTREMMLSVWDNYDVENA